MSDAWEYEKTEEAPEEEVYAPLKYEIVNYPADTTCRGYLDLWNSGQIKVPDFQRNYVWDQRKASKLIESFLLGLPVPGVFLFKPRSESIYQVIDGQQRIFSLIFFQIGRFEDNSTFKLRGVQPVYEGKSYAELSEEDRFKLDSSVLRATIIQQLSPDDHTSIYQIFERLNTGGINLNAMEIRQSVSFGPFVSMLKDLNSYPAWRSIVGSDVEDKRLRDVELVLRVLALASGWRPYEKPMKGFLNEYMEHMRGKVDEFEALGASFKGACDRILEQLGPRPFHLRSRLNYGLMDSFFVATIRRGGDKLAEAYKALVEDREYLDFITFNTSDASYVNGRISLAIAAMG